MLKSVGIVGLGIYAPEKVMTNADWEKLVDTSDEWIRTRTGIQERRYVVEGQGTSDLGVEAAKKALEDAGMIPEDVEFIILATCTPDYRAQNASSLIQAKLGAVNAAAFDLSAACSGFIYALSIGKSMIQSGMYKNILVIAAESISKIVNMQDRNTAILFGDGAAAAVLKEVEDGYGIISSFLGTEGVLDETLRINVGGTLNPVTHEAIDNGDVYLKMNGQEVFKFAVKALPKSTKEALKVANMEAEELDMVIPHQANMRIIEAAAKRLRLPMEKFFVNLQKYGNTSAASVGLALGEAVQEGKIKKGDMLALTGFGAGLTYGSVIIKWAK
ncbi:beta-ketoacyl-ACP synthase III [Fusobacterium sp.]|uniref:beta-ketoacyl-ACP synthase III n=1 Tax=Fusobacterium sp. TaxID=68766 RepID=UPI002632D5E0|nr:beta-ketoacyl-ACP synthase III [Fusobacterium sp.]